MTSHMMNIPSKSLTHTQFEPARITSNKQQDECAFAFELDTCLIQTHWNPISECSFREINTSSLMHFATSGVFRFTAVNSITGSFRRFPDFLCNYGRLCISLHYVSTVSTMNKYYIITEGIVQWPPLHITADLKLWVWVWVYQRSLCMTYRG